MSCKTLALSLGLGAVAILSGCNGSDGGGGGVPAKMGIATLGADFVKAFNQAPNDEPFDAQAIKLTQTPRIEPFDP